MRITSKVLLLISVTGLLIGSTNLFWGIGLPIGAVFFGLFLIFKLLEKESAQFDEEHLLRMELAARNSADNLDPITLRSSSNRKIVPVRGRASA